jgi:hypothetical protein
LIISAPKTIEIPLCFSPLTPLFLVKAFLKNAKWKIFPR